MNKFFLLFLVVLFSCEKEDINFPIWRTQTVSSDSNVGVYYIAIDSSNCKWFGTTNGVYMYDGSNWINYAIEDRMVDKAVRTIAIDSHNVKWIGTYLGFLKLENNQFTTISYESVSCIAIDANDCIWFGTSGQGIFKYDREKLYNYTTVLPNTYVNDIKIDKKGNIWIGTGYNYTQSPGGLTKFDGKNWITFKTSDGLSNNIVNAIAIDKYDNVFCGTSNGVSKFDGNSWFTYYESNGGLAENWIMAIAVDNYDNVWCGTSKGVSKFNGKSWEIFNKNSGLMWDYITTIAIDMKNHKWLGSLAFSKVSELIDK